jgi:tetratricopeptide (TPR) repeat protein
MHTYIAPREIALIAGNILAYENEFLANNFNIIRFELACLFADQISEGKTPPGIISGIGMYTQNLAEIFTISGGQVFLPNSLPLKAIKVSLSWEELWEQEANNQDLVNLIQHGSITAYLIDTYGWDKFLSMLSSMATSNDYAATVEANYGKAMKTLSQEWKDYFYVYIHGRWQSNLIYNHDLVRYEQLIAAGAYTEAVSGLTQNLSLLEKIGNNEYIKLANKLLVKAKDGQQAEDLFAQSRMLFEEGDYPKALEHTQKAKSIYSRIDASQRESELIAFEASIGEIQIIRSYLTKIQPQENLLYSNIGLIKNVTNSKDRLAKLGDRHVQILANEILMKLEQKEIERRITAVIILFVLCLLFMAWHIVLVIRKPGAVIKFH